MLIVGTAVNAMNYGLKFNSNDSPVAERTSLSLNDGKPLPVYQRFTLSFEIETRPEMSMFGCVVGLTGNDGTDISVVYSPEGSLFYPTLVVNDRIFPCVNPVSTSPVETSLLIDKKNGLLRLIYSTDTVAAKLDMKTLSEVSITFGARVEYETPPINVANIQIHDGDRLRYHWELSHHDDKICYDQISRIPARADNPHWMLDDHKITRRVYSLKTADRIQTAFDPLTASLFIVSDSVVNIVNLPDSTSRTITVKGGYREMTMSNNLVYRPSTGELVSFDLNRGTIATFDFPTATWSNPESHSELEAVHANHSWALQGDSVYYSFGGYGFFRFSNDMYRLDLNSNTMEQIQLRPRPAPRNGAASAVVGDRLYIFGGKGNETGRQELPTRYYYDLYEYDLATMQGRKVWEMDTVSNIFLNASTMYYDEETRSFLVATTQFGRSVARIYLDRPAYSTVVKPLHLDMGYRDCVYDFFYAPESRTYYLLVDRLLTDKTHDLNVYAVEGPLALDNNTGQHFDTLAGSRTWIWWIIGGLALLGAAGGAALALRRRRNRLTETCREDNILHGTAMQYSRDVHPGTGSPEPIDSETPGPDAATDTQQPNPTDNSACPADATTEPEETDTPDTDIYEEEALSELTTKANIPAYYDRSRMAISLLGNFNVTDRDGKNITTAFSSRTKKLLLLLLLVNKKNKNGVPMHLIDETIWGDKDEVSARNNRNVYMRRLRLLLEKVGDITITFDNGYFKLDAGNVFIDYYEVIGRMQQLDEPGADEETIERTLELLLYGPLLPNTVYEWLDQYKGDYSHRCLVCLTKLLADKAGNDEESDTAYRIAQTIMRHDTLSEEALRVQCRILHRRHMTGLAKALYNNFCKECHQVMGDDFATAFQSLID